MDKDLKNKTLTELEDLVESFGGKKYIAKYIFSFIHTKNTCDINDITPVSKQLRSKFTGAGYYIGLLRTVERTSDTDGTAKYLFEAIDGCQFESVLLVDDERNTVCLSCQVGCRMGCEFCATAKLKLKRNLTAGEIADQVYKVSADAGRISNVVYMGMGEPMDNLDEVLRSIDILNDPAGRNIGQRHMTVSTSGLIKGIQQFTEQDLSVRLAVSLNAVSDDLRSRIMPATKKYPIREVIKVVKDYQIKTHRRVTFEYCMLKGMNDSKADARKLIQIIEPIKANVNLIEYNTHPGCDFSPSDRSQIRRFADILKESGIEVSIRYRRGRNIKAACGQLGADEQLRQ